MKKPKQKQKQKPKAKPKPKMVAVVPANFMVSDSQQKAGEQGYENTGLYGIGMIKAK